MAEVHQNLSNVGEHILTMFAKFIEISRSEKCIRRVQKCANTVDLKKCCKLLNEYSYAPIGRDAQVSSIKYVL